MKGKINISFTHTTGGGRDSYVTLTIEDSVSGVRILRGGLSFEEFGKVIHGQAQDIEVNLGRLELINAEVEIQNHEIFFSKGHDDPREVIEQACETIRQSDPDIVSVTGHESSLGNMHKAVHGKDGYYRVSFNVYRKKQDGKEESK